jgi:HAD superfamily hydrolase (TIGR01509 family)
MDGVLVDSREAWFQVVNAVRSGEGMEPITAEGFAPCWGQGILVDVDVWFPHMSVPDLERRYGEEFARQLEFVNPMAGVRPAVQRLRDAGLRTACATNTPGEIAEGSLGHAGIRDLLDDVMGATEAGKEKPDPRMLQLLAERAGVGPESCVMVGDTPKDFEAARRFGCRFAGFGMTEAPEGESCFTEMSDLADWILGLC